MDIQNSNSFKGNIVEDSFMHGKCYDRPHNYPKLENKQVLNLPPMPHKRFNKIYDRTRYHNDMQFGDGSTWATFPVMQLTNRGWTCAYDGIAAYGGCGNNISLNCPNAITAEMGVKPVVKSVNDFVLQKREATKGYYFVLNDAVDQKMGVFIKIDGISRSVWGNDGLPSNVWSHVLGVYDGTRIQLFIDSIEQTPATNIVGSVSTTSNPLIIGKNYTDAGYFNGTINMVKVYDRSLSAAKRKDNWWRHN